MDATAGEVAQTAGVIRSSARLALEELRTVISVLRDPTPPPAGSPSDLGALVEESRRAGMRVELRDQEVCLSEVPDAVGRAAYRIVQEGLTNARKHAPGQPVTVLVSGTKGAELVVEVRNPPHGGPAALAATGAGAGLAGLAERAALAGGRVECGETADGGFKLAARLPWPR
ncbi:hypothetical protein GCM10022419_036500 [Nonomuraea rosea]|uniref:histidine kinase n=1 Tax=Nonomuraea rosea TaxID=638574 RepID=A0ABP6WKF2_9ACTN